MDEEGGGPSSPFFPSSAKTNVGGIIPSNFFMDSETCGECHKDIYEQWNSSAHHFASFNNQFYRKVDRVHAGRGRAPSRASGAPAATTTRCSSTAGSSGRSRSRSTRPRRTPAWPARRATPSRTWTARWGTAASPSSTRRCMSWRAARTRHPRDGQLPDLPGSRAAPPDVHEAVHARWIRAEFCSSCHKVHLDVPVNDYRWFRGFNDYDNWQASGVSGQGARSFYYPPESSTCVDCHMPLVAVERSGQPRRQGPLPPLPGGQHGAAVRQQGRGADEGHRGLPEVGLHHGRHLRRVAGRRDAGGRRWCAAPATAAAADVQLRGRRGGGAGRRRSSSATSGKVAAPIDQAAAGARAGHHRPRRRRGAHAQDRPLLPRRHRRRVRRLAGAAGDAMPTAGSSSGAAGWRTTGKGPVEPGAHFYRAYQLDGEGNPINKRNAWQARSVLYVRLIPPGAADVAHYRRARSPRTPRGRSRFTAKLNYRKFSHYYTQFAYAGQPEARAGSGALSRRVTTASSTRSTRRTSRRTSRARSRTRSRTCRSSRWRRRPRRCRSATRRREPHGSRSSRRRTASAGTTGASACCCRAI